MSDSAGSNCLARGSSVCHHCHAQDQWCILPFNADVMTSAHFGTSKNSKLSFPLPASIFAKYFNSSMFLRTAYMLLCVQTQNAQIALLCSNFNTVVHKGEIQCPPPPFTICSECTRAEGPVSDHVLENFPRNLPATTPHDISTSTNKDMQLHVFESSCL